MAWTYIMFFFQEWVFPAFTYHWYPFLSFLFLFRKTVPFHCHYMTYLFYFDCVTLIIVAWENAAVIVLSHPFVWKQKQTKRFTKKYKNSQLNQYQTISFCNNLRLNWSNWLMFTQISILQYLHLKVYLQVCKSLYIYIYIYIYIFVFI